MRLFLILVMAAAAMAWRNFRSRKQAEEAHRHLLQLLADQAADEDDKADREISENLDI
jgi:ABC-type nickel/cobalt efflux system permease component RcnA